MRRLRHRQHRQVASPHTSAPTRTAPPGPRFARRAGPCRVPAHFVELPTISPHLLPKTGNKTRNTPDLRPSPAATPGARRMAASATNPQAAADQITQGTNPWIIAAAVMLATFMEVLDTSIAAVALPYIAGSLSASNDEATWVLTSYLVSNAIVLPMSNWMSLRFGRKKVPPELRRPLHRRLLRLRRRHPASPLCLPHAASRVPAAEPSSRSRRPSSLKASPRPNAAPPWPSSPSASSSPPSSAPPSAAGSPTPTPGATPFTSTSPSASLRCS